MRNLLLFVSVLLLSGCLHFGSIPGYERRVDNGRCAALVVDNRNFADMTIYLDNSRRRVGFAPGLTETSFQMCGLTYETASLVADPVGGRPFVVPFPVSPMGARLVRVTLGSTESLTTMQIF